MRNFMDKDFLLTTEFAQRLYHEFAAQMPIIDYHCHIPPREIAEDVHFSTITQVWLGADHYKWRQMRTNGVPERYITGDASDFEKFEKWAETLERAIGNPLYHWSHLELQRYFGIYEPLTKANAARIYEECNKKLQEPSMSARGLILRSNVKLLCTTDDPTDDLHWHKQIADDASFPVKVLPAFRPDNALYIEKDSFAAYLEKLGTVCGRTVASFADLTACLTERLEYFRSFGCKVSDHGLAYVMYEPCTEAQADAILRKKLSGGQISASEELQYKTALLSYLGREYHRLGFVMQLHYGVKRNNNRFVFEKIGPDTGFDCIDSHTPSASLADFLNGLAETEQLPKTVLYSLNPADNAAIGTIIGCFQDESAVAKIQQGSAWWFNDNKTGMEEQMTSLANLGLLANFIGMLTDSRSFLSYTRHEYFRRILCNLIGQWVDAGEYPADLAFLGSVVQDIAFRNCNRYFDFQLSD
ncbi:MAG: glucuronate isomerase [Lachnospiraceae bacterium]|nr:glucuronate isomerase [Lachnospiraceae bacterium]